MSYTRYSPEQLEKIERLRKENEDERLKSIKRNKTLKEGENVSPYKPLDVDSRVYIKQESCTIIGYIVAKYGDKWNTRFDVSTPYGLMKNVEKKYVYGRYYEDLSHVVIPEELKAIPTMRLLDEISARRIGDDYPYLSQFDNDQIKAELRNRPNIGNKRAKRLVQKSK